MSRRKCKRNKDIKQNNMKAGDNNKMQLVKGSSPIWTEIRTLPVGILRVDKEYQRHLNWSWAKEIAEKYDPVMVDVLHVSYRDGFNWIFDGQHRAKGIELRFNDPNYPVVCKVYHGLTKEDESELFYKYNTLKKKMSSAEMLKSQIVFGDKEAQSFLDLTRSAGFIINPSKRVNCLYGIQAVKKAQDCFKTLGPKEYVRMLTILKNTWDGEKWSITNKMLGGMCKMVAVYGELIDDNKFASQLMHVTESQIIKEAGRFYEETVPVAYASALVKFYNKGLRKGRLKRSLLLDD